MPEGEAIILAAMNNISRKVVPLAMGVIIWSFYLPSTEVQGTAPQGVQDWITVRSPEGSVAKWGRGLDAPFVHGRGSDSRASVVIKAGKLRPFGDVVGLASVSMNCHDLLSTHFDKSIWAVYSKT